MTFQKVVENFVCEHCGHKNRGTGFTDHCENCLWSKHVDIDPGDRAESCAGLMEPVEAEVKSGEYKVLNRCNRCGFERFAKVLPTDNFQIVLRISEKKAGLS